MQSEGHHVMAAATQNTLGDCRRGLRRIPSSDDCAAAVFRAETAEEPINFRLLADERDINHSVKEILNLKFEKKIYYLKQRRQNKCKDIASKMKYQLKSFI